MVPANWTRPTESGQMWKQRATRATPYLTATLGDNYMKLGQWEMALLETEESLRLEGNSYAVEGNLAWIQLALGRTEDARRTVEQALARKLDGLHLRSSSYLMAFLRGDQDAMQRELVGLNGRSGEEDGLLSVQSDTEAYFGRLASARAFSQRAVESARRRIPTKPPLYGRPMPPCARRSLAMRWPLVENAMTALRWHRKRCHDDGGAGVGASGTWRRPETVNGLDEATA